MKHEWKKHEKELYSIKKEPSVITVPRQKFIMISGKGNPNDADFSERVGALYSLAYSIKMRHKAFCSNNPDHNKQFEYLDYTVFPLEGIWTSAGNSPLDKDSFEYTIMIRQPDFITQEMFEAAYSVVEKKKPHPFLKEVVFDTMEDGLCVQMLHIGLFDDEPASFALMDAFSKDNGLERISHTHREIYLNDARKVQPAKYQTILRYQVRKGGVQ
ncbi:hypothetical protein SAMN05446037_10288 [Anaerovirgula multivorans]|uniref:GyrI-like small molecule binding domain-containing protein n=1 Tax=Anaerovirgula multivorans TaxID=312168 RepID=A0A239IGC1_9FIRM|nr:GyrI-like domain-containing protein [Anaerovirgula multivorans]SNS92720.1 hypothetical protein SAMN05446037_10288 [Anaerovirgula multivorans]